MDAAKLRELAAEAEAHVGEWDHVRANFRRPQAPRSCAQCAFWSDQRWDGVALRKVPHGCDDPIVAGRKIPWRVLMDREEAEKCICNGWVYKSLADLLRAGYAFDAIALEVRKPDPAEAPGGRERLTALIRARTPQL